MSTPAKQSRHHFSYAIAVNNSPERVRAFLRDVSRWHEWDTEITEATLSGDFAVGAEGELVPKKGPKLAFYISAIVPGVSYTFNTRMPVGELVIKRMLEEKGDFVVFTDDIQFTGFLKRAFGLLLGGGFRKVLPEVMENFKRLAEQEQGIAIGPRK